MNSLHLNFGGYSICGTKQENQDAIAAYQPEGSLLEHKGAVATIADGLSSALCAKEAASTCATMFIQDYLQTPQTWSVERSASQILKSLNSWCFAQSYPELSRLESKQLAPNYLTTFSSVIFRGTKAYVFHVGDTRIHRWQNNEVELLTRDHKTIQNKHEFLSRAVGADSHLEVDMSVCDTRSGDLFMLSSDGLHQFVTLAEIKEVLLATHSSLEVKAQAIVEKALANGSDDNISCLFVDVVQAEKQSLSEQVATLTKLAIPPVMQLGNSIDGYEVLDILFKGTRSNVYKVQCQQSRNIYALKTPSLNFKDNLVYLRGFIKEQWIGEQINDKKRNENFASKTRIAIFVYRMRVN